MTVESSETLAVPLDWLDDASGGPGTGQPLCPACSAGRLHPFKVTVVLSRADGAWNGADYLEGWVAVCQGNRDHLQAQQQIRDRYRDGGGDSRILNVAVEAEQPPCGFSMPMQAQRHSFFHPGTRR
jgi:hypothetical protein